MSPKERRAFALGARHMRLRLARELRAAAARFDDELSELQIEVEALRQLNILRPALADDDIDMTLH